MTELDARLRLSRCPHCNDEPPSFAEAARLETRDHSGQIQRKWKIYKCLNCGGLITTWALDWDQEAVQTFPDAQNPDDAIPARPRAYLFQAIESLHSPAGSVMLAASAVDAMLRLKGYKEGNLYGRIEQAVKDHLITPEMERWAHEIRLDANDQRHADGNFPLPNITDAKQTIELAQIFAQYMFCFPARVQAGIKEAGS
ncbi:MAG: DUF4145 domain-containing protein [Proteobacteria bacterium]|nr:DUF4145 domain-containing protein [Pseudomonadota bacterium]